jgi:WD40 repeat protein
MTIRLWAGAWKQALEGHSGYHSAVAFSLDGKALASGSWDTALGRHDLGCLWIIED